MAKNVKKSESQIATVMEIEISKIQPSSLNPRENFDEESLQELAESISKQGLLSPIMVRPIGDLFEIVYGERRFRAIQLLKMPTITALVKSLSDDEAENMAITENLIRKDITPLEEAKAFQRLIDKRKHTVETLSVQFGKDKVYIYSRLKLNQLVPDFQALLGANALPLTVFNELIKYSPEVQQQIHDERLGDHVNQYQTWVNFSAKKIIENIKAFYSYDLAFYPLLHASCHGCPQNSSTSSLFSDEPLKCYDKECLRSKVNQHLFDLCILIDDLFPSFTFAVKNYHGNQLLAERLTEKGFTLKTFDSYNDLRPDFPEVPDREDFEEEDFEEAMADHREEVEEYYYQMAELQKKCEQGEIEQWVVITSDGIDMPFVKKTKVVLGEQDEQIQVLEEKQQELAKNEKRFREIKDENIAKDFCTILKSPHSFNEDLSELEVTASYWGMLSYLKTERWSKFGAQNSTWSLTDSDKEIILNNLTEERKQIIQRDFIESALCGATGEYSQKLRSDYIFSHFPDEHSQIEEKYSEVLEKRLKTIEADRKELDELLSMLENQE